ncbi:MAG: hypothetical protein LBR62_01455 [Puniceicoccales bacterium]|jgi:hypothetical protein|nr:hypothetical protein [Puniceicoccales bacterium]
MKKLILTLTISTTFLCRSQDLRANPLNAILNKADMDGITDSPYSYAYFGRAMWKIRNTRMKPAMRASAYLELARLGYKRLCIIPDSEALRDYIEDAMARAKKFGGGSEIGLPALPGISEDSER